MLGQLRAAVRAGTFDDRGLGSPRESSALTFRQFAERIRSGTSSPRDWPWQRPSITDLLLIERFGDFSLIEIRTADVEDFIVDLKKPRCRRAHARSASRDGVGQPNHRTAAPHDELGSRPYIL
ncbi:MAG: hypothetical protein MZV70_07715 [Desulfobacterales bacterium]|nr:hypothetical protein [Desulfobacterales bacterium]